MADGVNSADNSNRRNDLGLHGEGNEQRERPFARNSVAEERDDGFMMTTRNGGGSSGEGNHGRGQLRLRTFDDLNDQGLAVRDSETTSSKFKWTNFLPEAKKTDDFLYDSNGRKYVRVSDEKPVPTECEQIRNIPGCRSYAQLTGNPEHNRMSRNSSGPLHGDRDDFRVREYPPHQDREMSRRGCGEGTWDRFYSHDSPPCLTPRSQSGGQHTPPHRIPMDTLPSLRQDVHHSADGQPTRHESSQQILRSKAGVHAHRFSGKGVEYPQADYYPNVNIPTDYINPEIERFSELDPNKLHDKFNERVRYVRKYNRGDVSGNNVLGHSMQKLVNVHNSRGCILRKDGSQSIADALQEEPAMYNYNGSYASEAQHEKRISVPRNTYHECRIDGTQSHEVVPHDKVADYETKNHEIYYEEDKYYVAGQQEPHYEKEIYVPRNGYHGCGIGSTESHEAMIHEEVSDYETNNLDSYYEEHEDYVAGQQGGVCITDEYQGWELGDYDFSEQRNRMPKRKHRFVGIVSQTKRRATTIGSRGAFSHDNVQLNARLEKNYTPSLSFNHHGEFQARECIRVSNTGSRQPFGGLSEALQSRLSKPPEYSRGDMRKRLKHPHIVSHPCHPKPPKFWKKPLNYVKPCPYVSNIMSTPESHGNSKGTKFKKGLNPAPQMLPATDLEVSYPSPKQHKLPIENSGSMTEACPSLEADVDHSKLKAKPAEKDLPEDSEEFKQQVHEWFLKSMQLLNANPGRQKRFKEEGKVGCLKCIICSSFKEFMDTKDVAMHAFTSLKVGFRAQHLGFHRALCVLMGWDTALNPNGRWVRRPLPDADAWALKEDIIIWPPVVIIQISHVRSDHPNDQVKISTEHLENILRDEGFDKGKIKVCQGKAGNPNIKVLKFNGTLSGLQEAERLHNFFAEKKQGRSELLQAAAKVNCVEDAKVPSDDAKDALYGYLGIIEDLDKLHYDMKRYHCAKSKKEIMAFADAAGPPDDMMERS